MNTAHTSGLQVNTAHTSGLQMNTAHTSGLQVNTAHTVDLMISRYCNNTLHSLSVVWCRPININIGFHVTRMKVSVCVTIDRQISSVHVHRC